MSARHLTDDRLIELSLAGAAATSVPHLAACPACLARHASLTSLLGEVSAAATLDADAAFPPDRLARQQARILQRVEQDGRPGQLIAFPNGGGHRPLLSRSRSAARWVAAAAAAGLMLGLAGGQFLRIGRGPVSSLAPRMAASDTASGRVRPVAAALSDDEFLGQVEFAGIAGPSSLRPLDALTPRVWD